ncbi:hypothetical protein D3C76_1613290 [compost metagenome]
MVLRKIIEKIVITTNDPELTTAAQRGYVDLAEPRRISWRFMDRTVDEISLEHTGKFFYVGDDEYLDPWTLQPLF